MVLVSLEKGPMRSADLRRTISPGLDWRGFIDTINRLLAKDLILRHGSSEHDATPDGLDPHHSASGHAVRDQVWYELTATGHAVLQLLADVEAWARDHPEDAARLRPDASRPDN